MSENSIRGSRDQASRVLKSNAYTGRRSGTPDSPNSGQGAASPVPNAGPGSPTSTTSSVTNHHPVSHVQHHPNHRPYTQRGRHRGDGGYFGGHNHLGGHHSGSYRRPSPPIPGPPFSKALVDFMIKQWNDFEVNYKKSRGEPVDNGLMPPPAAPTSPRVPTSHMNSPHRGQHTRYPYHQNSTGNSWSVNSGGGRRFSDNGDHSNTGSLRRHHARGGHAASPLPQNNSSWQRSSILGNRQNSPNNTLNRPAGPRHLQHPHRPVASPTPPPVAEATSKKAGNAGGSPVVEAAAAQLETLTIKSSEAQQQEVASTSSETAAAASAARKKNTEGGANGEVRTAEDEKCAVSSTSPNDEASRTSPRVKHQQQHQTPSHHQHQRYIHPPRRRAATTQSSGSGLQVGTAAFSLPASVAGGSAPRALETASVASSSFCSLIDQGSFVVHARSCLLCMANCMPFHALQSEPVCMRSHGLLTPSVQCSPPPAPY
uniref:PAP-associated domain-containing protein n=1 Tax=Mesocestoides corti TaxID=53468 RepID=A0A5K3FI16_MESCO